MLVLDFQTGSDVIKDLVFKAKAMAFKAKAKDLQKKQGQGLGTKAKAKKLKAKTKDTQKPLPERHSTIKNIQWLMQSNHVVKMVKV